MGKMQIDFGVNTNPLDQAKRKLDDLKETIDSLRSDPGGGSTLNSEALRTISEDITRMKALVNQGENKGGVLNLNQWKELDRVTGRINKNFDDWNKNLLRVGGELQKAKKLVANLEQDGRIYKNEAQEPEFHRQYNNALAERDRLEKEYAGLKKADPAKERLADKAQDLSARAGMLDMEQQGPLGFGWKKLLGTGLALAGGFSVLSYLTQSRNEYRKYEQELGGLAARGIRGVNPGLGFGSLESVQIMRGITHGTGYSGKAASGLYRDVTAFARANDVDPGQATSLLGSYRDLTGDRERSRRSLYLLTHIAENTKETPERINRTLGAGFSALSAAQGGRELSAQQQGEFAAFAERMAKSLGTMGKNPAMIQAMGGAFQGTGNRMVDLLISEAVGLVGDGPITGDKLARAESLRGKGLLTKENRALWRKAMTSGSGAGLDPAMKRNVTRVLLKGTVTDDESLGKIAAALESGELERLNDTQYAKYLAGLGDGVTGTTGRKVGAYRSTEGARVNTQEAQRERLRIKTGKRINTIMMPLEDSILNMGEKFIQSDVVDSVTKKIEKLTKGAGWVMDSITDAAQKPSAQTPLTGMMTLLAQGLVVWTSIGRKLDDIKVALERNNMGSEY